MTVYRFCQGVLPMIVYRLRLSGNWLGETPSAYARVLPTTAYHWRNQFRLSGCWLVKPAYMCSGGHCL